jgi:hypothetical protein
MGTKPGKKPPAPSPQRRTKKPDVIALIAGEISKVRRALRRPTGSSDVSREFRGLLEPSGE